MSSSMLRRQTIRKNRPRHSPAGLTLAILTAIALATSCDRPAAPKKMNAGEKTAELPDSSVKKTTPNRVISPPQSTETISAQPVAESFSWPNWLGPNHDGITREKSWRSEWQAPAPPVLWRAQVGTGFSSFSSAEQRLFTMGNTGEAGGTEAVFCLSPENGKEIWRHAYPGQLLPNLHEGGPAATPTIDGNFVYTLGKEGQLFCLEAATGEVIWKTSLRKEFDVSVPEWGFSCSPRIYQEKLIVEGGRIACFDKHTGEKLWQTPPAAAGYGSPVVFEHQGIELIAVLTNEGLTVVQLDTGQLVAFEAWETSFQTNSSTPIVTNDQIFISTGYNKGCGLFQLQDDRFNLVYENRDMANHFNNSILWDGHLYGIHGNSHQPRLCTLVCMHWATGEVKWEQRGFGCGAVLLAGDKLVVLSQEGTLFVVEATSDAYREISQLPVFDASLKEIKCWTVPILVNGRLYCRNAEGDVVCIDVRDSKS